MEELTAAVIAAGSGVESKGIMGEEHDEGRKSVVCIRHEEIAADVREIKRTVQAIELRLERGESKFDMMALQNANCSSRLDKIDSVFTKVLVGVLIAVILGLGGFVFSGRQLEGGRHGGTEKGIEK